MGREVLLIKQEIDEVVQSICEALRKREAESEEERLKLLDAALQESKDQPLRDPAGTPTIWWYQLILRRIAIDLNWKVLRDRQIRDLLRSALEAWKAPRQHLSTKLGGESKFQLSDQTCEALAAAGVISVGDVEVIGQMKDERAEAKVREILRTVPADEHEKVRAEIIPMLQEIEDARKAERRHTVRPAEGWLPPYHAQNRIKLGVKILSRLPRFNAQCALEQWRWMAHTTFAEHELSTRVIAATPDFQQQVVDR